jgi:hypothetical protein
LEENMLNTRIITCALAVAGLPFIGNQAMAQGGPPGGLSVNVANTPLPVTVTNPTVPPSTVNVGNPAAIAAAIAAANAQAAGTPVGFTLVPQSPGNEFPVPAGQRLVIEYVSGICGPQTQSPSLFGLPSIFVTTNGVGNVHRPALPIVDSAVPPPVIPGVSTQVLFFGQVVKIYADPGSSVTIPTQNASFGLSSNCQMTFSGQLVTP